MLVAVRCLWCGKTAATVPEADLAMGDRNDPLKCERCGHYGQFVTKNGTEWCIS